VLKGASRDAGAASFKAVPLTLAESPASDVLIASATGMHGPPGRTARHAISRTIVLRI
jgi:hypothetical protein